MATTEPASFSFQRSMAAAERVFPISLQDRGARIAQRADDLVVGRQARAR